MMGNDINYNLLIAYRLESAKQKGELLAPS